MPRKVIRKSRKSNRRNVARKRKTYRRKTARNTATLVAKPSYGSIRQPFPPRLFTALTYSERFRLTQLVGGTPGVYTFRANSLYDPNLTGAGHQPRYFDTLCGADGTAAPYHHYRVHAVKVKFTVWSVTGDGNFTGMLAIIPRQDTASAVDSFDEMQERAYSRTKTISTYFTKPTVMKHYIKNKVLLGHKDLQDVDECAANYNNNPTEQVYIDFVVCCVDPDNTIDCNASVQLTYFAEFYGLTDVADS